MICDTCIYSCRPTYKSPCSECNMEEGTTICKYEHVPHTPTNADRIRAMSDEELARWICKKMQNCSIETCTGAELCNLTDGRANGLVKWLQQPA